MEPCALIEGAGPFTASVNAFIALVEELQSHIHDQGWHRRVVPVTIGVLDGLLVRPARGAIAAARTPGLASVMQAGERLAHVGWLTADAAPA